MCRTRTKVPLCSEEALTTQVLVDQVDVKSNGLLYSIIAQDAHKPESSPQVLITRSPKCGTSVLQAQESPMGLLVTKFHSRHDNYMGTIPSKCHQEDSSTPTPVLLCLMMVPRPLSPMTRATLSSRP